MIPAKKRIFLSAVLVAGFALTAGCQKPCEYSERPLPTEWTSHPDVIMPGGTICATNESGGRESAAVEYDSSDAYVQIKDHINTLGYPTKEMDLQQSDVKTMTFVHQSGNWIVVRFHRSSWPKPSRASYEYHTHPDNRQE